MRPGCCRFWISSSGMGGELSGRPIPYSLASGYAHLAVAIRGADAGCAVYGFEPEFEETSPVCQSFGALTELLGSILIGAVRPEDLGIPQVFLRDFV